MLDRDVFKVMIPSCGFHFDQAPATVPTAMQDGHFHEHTTVLKDAFKDRRNFRAGNLFTSGADRFIQPTVATNLDPTQKHLACERVDPVPAPVGLC